MQTPLSPLAGCGPVGEGTSGKVLNWTVRSLNHAYTTPPSPVTTRRGYGGRILDFNPGVPTGEICLELNDCKNVCKVDLVNWLPSIDISEVTRFLNSLSVTGRKTLDYSVYELIPLYSYYSNRKIIHVI